MLACSCLWNEHQCLTVRARVANWCGRNPTTIDQGDKIQCMLDGVEMEVIVKKKPQKDGSKVTASGSQIYILYLKPPGGGQLNGTDYIRSNDPYKMVKRAKDEVYSRAWRVCMGASVGACMGAWCVRACVRVRANDSSLCPIDCSTAARAHDESRGRTGRGGAGRGRKPDDKERHRKSGRGVAAWRQMEPGVGPSCLQIEGRQGRPEGEEG